MKILIAILVSFSASLALATTVLIAPEYPDQAIADCIEGWVIVQFTVLKGGETTNHEVINSHPKGVFEESALQQAKKLHYGYLGVDNPKINEQVDGVTFKFTYDLDEESEPYAHCR